MTDILDRLFLETAARLRLDPLLLNAVRSLFREKAGRPVVGVHIRRGDFKVADEHSYDASKTRHPAVPLWWHEHVMGQILRQEKDAAFFLSCTGDPGAYRSLRKNFDLFELPVPSPYSYKGPDHASGRHPVGDLFALACCGLIVASPVSSFSHYAANALGPASTVILPPIRMSREKPIFGWAKLHGQRLPSWNLLSREQRGLNLIEDSAVIPGLSEASVKWM